MMRVNIKNSSVFFAVISFLHSSSYAYVPGQLRRRLIGNLKYRLNLPHEAVNSLQSALKTRRFREALPDAAVAIKASARSLLPPFFNANRSFIAKNQNEMDRASMEECDCLLAQQEARQKEIPTFIHTILPSEVALSPSDRIGQKQWLLNNASKLQQLKQVHGGIFFQGWDILKDEEGLSIASKALGMKHCQDPAIILNIRPSLGEKVRHVFEASNHQNDSSTHIGLHNEATPGLVPKSALFACFQAADEGGEFLLCDGRRVLRDVNAQTLANMQARKYRAVFVEIPSWLSSAPGMLRRLPFTNRVHHELMSIAADLVTPTNAYELSFLPSKNNDDRFRKSNTLALTSQSGSPVARHHKTGEATWFCNIDTAHRGLFEKRNPNVNENGAFTTNAFDVVHGDGGPISEDDVNNIESAMNKNTREIAMKPGDGVFLDNWITMHGRKRFTGTRKHAVVWSSN